MTDVFAYETTGPSSHLFGVVDLTTGVFTPRGGMGQGMEGIGGILCGASHHDDTLQQRSRLRSSLAGDPADQQAAEIETFLHELHI